MLGCLLQLVTTPTTLGLVLSITAIDPYFITDVLFYVNLLPFTYIVSVGNMNPM